MVTEIHASSSGKSNPETGSRESWKYLNIKLNSNVNYLLCLVEAV
jgi:hypothetical protein